MTNAKISRRQFIKTAAAAGTIAFPYVITTSALGGKTKLPACERVTLGHIGVGGQGSWLLKNFIQLKEAQSVAVADPNKKRRDKGRYSR